MILLIFVHSISSFQAKDTPAGLCHGPIVNIIYYNEKMDNI